MPATAPRDPGPMDIDLERRRFARIRFPVRVQVQGPTGTWEAVLLDVSLKGALVTRPEAWAEHMPVARRLCVELDPSSGHSFCADVAVAHVQEDRIGFRWERIDLEAASHLRRLVELNLGDPSLLDRELDALGARGDERAGGP